jgi:predicted Zn-ribbon and HTH transcriptional regulator
MRPPNVETRTVCRNCGYGVKTDHLDPDIDQCPECGTTAFNLGRRRER